MKHLFPIAMMLLLAFPLSTVAGPDKDSIAHKKAAASHWKKTGDHITGKIARPSLIKMKTTAEALHSFLQDSCLGDARVTPVWHGEYCAENTADGEQLKYGITCDFAGGAGNATLTIRVNDLSPLTGHITIDNRDVMTLPANISMRNDCPCFEPQGANAQGITQSIWLVTASPDMLPYIPISRKEYLEMILDDLNVTKQRIIADVKGRTPVRSAEEQAAEKKRDLTDLSNRYSGNELEVRTRGYLERYKSDEDYLKQTIEKATAEVDTTLYIIHGMLSHLAPATLAAPAIVSPTSHEFLGFRDGEPGMVMLIRTNPSFFEPRTAREKARFFLITWNTDASNAATAELTSLIGKDLDTRILKEMLKK